MSEVLKKLINLEKDARQFGFDWPDQLMIIEQAMDECREILDSINAKEPPERVQEEIGDLLHTAISLCVFSGFDVEETIHKVNKKFLGRLEKVRCITHERGLKNLQGQGIEYLLSIWKEAKKQEHK